MHDFDWLGTVEKTPEEERQVSTTSRINSTIIAHGGTSLHTCQCRGEFMPEEKE
jgi:hypothetical protein